MYSEQLTQQLSIAGQIAPQTLNNAAANVTNIDLSKGQRLIAVINVGAVTGGGSLVAKLQESKTSGGSYQDIAGATATAITASTKVVTIEVRADQLDAGYQFVKLILTEGGSQNVVCGAIVHVGEAEYKPSKANDIAATSQRLVV